ncbi:hypothetical protein HK405_014140, partial [Cladochytrium tenue]
METTGVSQRSATSSGDTLYFTTTMVGATADDVYPFTGLPPAMQGQSSGLSPVMQGQSSGKPFHK